VSQADVELARQLFEAFDGGQLDLAASYLAADVEWDNTVLIDEEILRGREAVLEYWQRILASMPFAHEDHRILDAGEHVCALVRIRARGAGSGAETTVPVGYVVSVRDGAVARVRLFASQARALKAVGLEE
jgi:ketosteroid isomerase-like protein